MAAGAKFKSVFFLITFLFLSPSAWAVDTFSTYEKADYYHRNSFEGWIVAYDILRGFYFNGDESVLDMGCRDGRIAANLAGRIPDGEVIAIEMRGPGSIQFAQKNYSQELYPNLTFIEQNILNSDYENRFDLIVSFSFLHWNSDQAAIVQKAYQALKDEGQLVMTIPLKVIPEISANFKELMNKDEWKEYFVNFSHPRKKYTAQEYTSLLVDAGFEFVQSAILNREYLFENKRALIDWLKMHSVVDSLPEEKVENFLIQFANVHAQEFTYPDGQIPFYFEELLIVANK